MSSSSDPRDASREVQFSLPRQWYGETDTLGMMGMLLAGSIMVTRNRYLAWPSLIFGINGIINQHPLRTKERANPWQNLMLCVSALLAAYFPYVVLNASPL